MQSSNMRKIPNEGKLYFMFFMDDLKYSFTITLYENADFDDWTKGKKVR